MTGGRFVDPITRIRMAVDATRKDARDTAFNLMNGFDGIDPSALVKGAGVVQGLEKAANDFEDAVKKAFGRTAEDDEDHDA